MTTDNRECPLSVEATGRAGKRCVVELYGWLDDTPEPAMKTSLALHTLKSLFIFYKF